MIQLKQSLAAWQTTSFNAIFKSELQAINARLLPLQAGLSQGGCVAEDEGFTVMVLDTSGNDTAIMIKVGISYASIIAGCACADDPTPLDSLSEYCELLITIDRTSAEANISLIND